MGISVRVRTMWRREDAFFRALEDNIIDACSLDQGDSVYALSTKLVSQRVYNQIIIVIHSEHSLLGAGTYRIVVYVKNQRTNKILPV